MAGNLMTPVKMPDGTTCYSGANCKKHGFLTHLKAKIDNLSTTNENPQPKISNPSRQPHATLQDTNYVRKGLNTPNEESPLLQQLNYEGVTRRNTLTDEENGLLGWYSSLGYEGVNLYNRDGEQGIINYVNSFREGTFHDKKETITKYMEKYVDTTKKLDAILRKSGRRNRNRRILYRSVTIPENSTPQEYAATHYSVGSTVTDNGYASTSVDPDTMLLFNTHKEDRKIVFEILTSKGTAIHHPKRSPIPALNVEREVLLPRQMKYKVINVITARYTSSYPNGRPENENYTEAKAQADYTVVQLEEIQ